MSSIIGRILLTVGAGVVAAVIYTILNRREEHAQEQSNRSRFRSGTGRRNSAEYRQAPTWEDDPYDEELVRKRPVPSNPQASRSNEAESSEPAQNNSSRHAHWSCPICLDTFQDLKRKGTTIFSTPCGHLFCQICIIGALGTRPSVCPSCRKHTLITDCHPIYL